MAAYVRSLGAAYAFAYLRRKYPAEYAHLKAIKDGHG